MRIAAPPPRQRTATGRMVGVRSVGNSEEGRCAILGLSPDPVNNDLRDAPALPIAQEPETEATVRTYSPAALKRPSPDVSGLVPAKMPMRYREHALIHSMTEWNEFRNLDFDKLKTALRQPVFFDLRNVYEPDRVAAFGFRHISVGRPSKAPS
jgi:UDPglucose 6-dehydrogenase